MTAFVALLALCSGALTGCRQDMFDQARYETLEASEFFWDGASARPLVAGVVPYGENDDEMGLAAAGAEGGFPFEIDRADLERGRERYDIFCSPCHDRVGTGSGVIVQRGLRQPPSFHSPELRSRSNQHFFQVITQGFGVMPRYGPRIQVEDRWRIIAYVRALQLSQHAPPSLVPNAELERLDKASE